MGNDIDILKRAIKRYVLEPWDRLRIEYKKAKTDASYNGEMYGPSPPNLEPMLQELSRLLRHEIPDLAKLLNDDETKDKAKLRAERTRLKAELEHVEAQIKESR